MEIDALLTSVQELGRLTGVPTPYIDTVLALIRQRALQAGLYPRLPMRPVGGRRKVLTMHRIAGTFPPTRRAAYAISMSHDQRSLLSVRRPCGEAHDHCC